MTIYKRPAFVVSTLLLLNGFSAEAHLETPIRTESIHRSYHLEFDSSLPTHDRLRSKLVFTIDIESEPIESVRTFTEGISSDLGWSGEMTYNQVNAPSNVHMRVSVDDSSAMFVDLSTSRHDFVTTMEDKIPNFESKVFLSQSLGTFSAKKYVDKNGEQVLLSLSVRNTGNLFIDPIQKSYLQFGDAIAIELALVLPGGSNYTFLETISATEPTPALEKCYREGDVFHLPSTALPFGLNIGRVGLCISSSQGLTPIVLLANNPSHEPVSAILRRTNAALSHGGRISTNPLFKLPELSEANCIGYALLASGDKVLPAHAYWIQGLTARYLYTLGSSPAETLFSRYYSNVGSFKSDYYSDTVEVGLEHSSLLNEGDVLVFRGPGGIAHAGVVVREDQSWWLEQKFEEGPIVRAPIRSVHDVIANLYSTIEVLRRNR